MFWRLEVCNQCVGRAMLPLMAPEKNPSHAYLLASASSLAHGSMPQSSQGPPLCVSVQRSPFYKNRSHIGLGDRFIPAWIHLNSLYLQRPYFQIVTCWGFKTEMWWGGHISTHNSPPSRPSPQINVFLTCKIHSPHPSSPQSLKLFQQQL